MGFTTDHIGTAVLSCPVERSLTRFFSRAKPRKASLSRADEDICPYVVRARSIMQGVFLLQPEAFVHQPLQSRLVKNVEGEFFVGKHGQGCAFGAGRQF